MNGVSVVIPSRTSSLLQRAIDSIAATNTGTGIELIVIDDGLSQAPTAPWPIKYVTGPQPFCFARNVNLGIAAASRDNDIFLMNDDVALLTSESISLLKRALQSHSNIGVITPVFTSMERTPSQRYGHLQSGATVYIETKHHLTFAAALLGRNLLNAIGPLDEEFTGYGYEDNDYCLRSIEAGFSLGVLPNIVVAHGGEFGRTSVTYRAAGGMKDLLEFNRQLFLRKWASSLLSLDTEQCNTLLRLIDWC